MNDGEMEVIVVKTVTSTRVTVILPDTSEEDWSLASLPPDVQPGDRVGIKVVGGDFDMHLLPHDRSVLRA